MAALAVGYGPFRRVLLAEAGPLAGTMRPVNREAAQVFEWALQVLAHATPADEAENGARAYAWAALVLLDERGRSEVE